MELQVLYHELTHNVHDNHGNDFNAFMSQLIKQGDELDWTKHGGWTQTSSVAVAHNADVWLTGLVQPIPGPAF